MSVIRTPEIPSQKRTNVFQLVHVIHGIGYFPLEVVASQQQLVERRQRKYRCWQRGIQLIVWASFMSDREQQQRPWVRTIQIKNSQAGQAAYAVWNATKNLVLRQMQHLQVLPQVKALRQAPSNHVLKAVSEKVR